MICGRRYLPFLYGKCCSLSVESASTKGFTLLEVLVALGLAAVVAAAIYSSFSLAHNAIETVDQRLVRLQEARFLLDMMRREIEAGFCDRERTHTVFRVEDRDFYGRQASRLSLTTLTSLVPGVARIEYAVAERQGRLDLQKRVTPVGGLSGEGRDETMMEDIESFTLEVLHEGRWIRTWDCSLTQSLPSQVRISVVFSGRSQAERGQGPVTLSDYAFPRVGSRL